jgi:hypothetical protein
VRRDASKNFKTTQAFRCARAKSWLHRLGRVWSISSIAAENQLRNTSKRDGTNNCYRANPLPAGWAERQESNSISERSNSAKNEKRPCEKAMNAAASGSVNQAHDTHER